MPRIYGSILLGIMVLAVPGTSMPSISARFAEPLKVCREATWYDPVVFILLNHVVHLFSVKGWPDETVYDTAANLFLAFFMPYTDRGNWSQNRVCSSTSFTGQNDLPGTFWHHKMTSTAAEELVQVGFRSGGSTIWDRRLAYNWATMQRTYRTF